LSARVYIIVLNWNGWADTVECLQSLCLLEHKNVCIVVCDNNSHDQSLQHIQNWVAGNSSSPAADARYTFLTEEVLRPRGVVEWCVGQPASSTGDASLILIPTGGNLGFAGGCNAGLRYVLERGDADFVWLLNNDTVVEPAALTQLLRKMQRRPDLGLCGSTLQFYFQPDVVQCHGGYDFNAWTARVKHIECEVSSAPATLEAEVERRLKYVSGASTFLRIEFLRHVGLMNEQYFLYFEEIDWATRAHGLYALGYCAASRVYHKEGMSIGSHKESGSRSLLSERYLSRNRILFMRTYYPARVPLCVGWVVLAALHRLLSGKPFLARTMCAGAWEGLSCELGARPAASAQSDPIQVRVD
jgi:GT2 family glycosyltransferase